MNIHIESLLRSAGVFLSVFFTVRWGTNSRPVYDIYIMLISVLLALFLANR